MFPLTISNVSFIDTLCPLFKDVSLDYLNKLWFLNKNKTKQNKTKYYKYSDTTFNSVRTVHTRTFCAQYTVFELAILYNVPAN